MRYRSVTDLSRRDALLAAAAGAFTLSRPAFALAATDKAQTAMWDLTELYPNDAAWSAERDAVLKQLPSIQVYKGKLGDNAATLKAALTAVSEIGKKAARLAVYAGLKADEDLRVAPNQERR